MDYTYNDDMNLNLLPEENETRANPASLETNLPTSPTAGVSRDDVRSVTDFQRVTHRSSGWLRMT